MNLTPVRYKFPWLTLFLTLITLFIYVILVYLQLNTNGVSPEFYTYLGAPSTIEIYEGQYWGVITNSFLHNRFDILLANVAGLWILGAFIERRLRFYALFMLGLFASFITSMVQFTLTDDPGIGETGINYFLFFFIFIRGFYRESFKLKFRYLILLALLGILGWCIYKNQVDGWNMGIESMAAGIVFGTISGLISISRFKVLNFVFPILFMGIMSISFFYAPWSAEWHSNEGLKAHRANNLGKAKFHYQSAIRINPKNQNSTSNLFAIRLDALSRKAYNLHNAGKYIEARVYYDKVLKMDPSNAWAKEQINNLP